MINIKHDKDNDALLLQECIAGCLAYSSAAQDNRPLELQLPVGLMGVPHSATMCCGNHSTNNCAPYNGIVQYVQNLGSLRQALGQKLIEAQRNNAIIAHYIQRFHVRSSSKRLEFRALRTP